ncbi:uncharacterized protein [Nicotiana sylvestris]|uniref:uncharacterized protein n=1 Tax=Nicotiana sylvestris TaxID=4096 RepID=UPI00388C5977
MRIAILGQNKLGFIDGTCKKENYEIATARKVTSSIFTYFSKLRVLWEEFDSLAPIPGRDATNSRDFVQFMELQKLLQFLMGLNESYEQACSQLLMMVPMPSVNKAYSMLMERESQRTMASVFANMDNAEMTALITNRAGNQQKMRKNYNLFCDFCKMKSHTKETAPAGCIPTPTAQTFTLEQYQQILQLLNSKPTKVTATATDLELVPLDNSSSVHLPNENLAKITHRGSTNIFKDCKISDVLHVPHFKYNLLSVSKLTKELQCLVAFFPDLCVFKDLYTGKVLGIGSEANGIYILRSCLHEKQPSIPTVNTTAMQISTQNKQSLINLEVWHQRLGLFCLSISQGIFHQTTCVYTPQQNGFMERRHRYILEVARALRFQAAIPLRFWGECVLIAVPIINRLPSIVLKGGRISSQLELYLQCLSGILQLKRLFS